MAKKYKYPVEEVFKLAVQFATAVPRMHATMPPLVFASFTNIALAIELMFKTLALMEDREFIGTHDLKVLYDDLGEENKSQILLEWEKILKSNDMVQMLKVLGENGDKPETDLAINLEIAAHTFVEFRYGFEKAYQNKQFLLSGLEQSLMKMILRRDPTLRSVIPRVAPERRQFILPGLPRPRGS